MTTSDSNRELPGRRSNRAITIAHRIEFALVVVLLGFFRVIGIDAASALSGKFLRFVGPKLRSISKRGENNLRLVFPDWSEEKVSKTMEDVWENLGRTAAEYAHLDKITVIGDAPRIDYHGVEKIAAIIREHGRAVFVTGHFANWEVSGIAAHQLDLKFGVIYRALNNPLIDELIIKKRGDVMTRRQIPKGMAGARPLIDLLKDGYSLAILSDQKLNTGGISVPFMGHPSMTSPAAARIAVRFKIPVVPSTTERLTGAYFRVTTHDPIDFTPTGDLEKDVAELTLKINEQLEKDIRANPGQWLWLHRRWAKRKELSQ